MRQHLEQSPEEIPGGLSVRNSWCGELYQLYAPRLLAYFCHHLPSLHDAEDALLDVFLAALEHEAHVRALAPERQSAWLWAVARNRMVDYHRQQKREAWVSLGAVEEIEDERQLPEQEVLCLETDAQVRKSISQLSPLQQEVLTLRFAGGLRCTEIARVINKRQGAVRALLTGRCTRYAAHILTKAREISYEDTASATRRRGYSYRSIPGRQRIRGRP